MEKSDNTRNCSIDAFYSTSSSSCNTESPQSSPYLSASYSQLSAYLSDSSQSSSYASYYQSSSYSNDSDSSQSTSYRSANSSHSTSYFSASSRATSYSSSTSLSLRRNVASSIWLTPITTSSYWTAAYYRANYIWSSPYAGFTKYCNSSESCYSNQSKQLYISSMPRKIQEVQFPFRGCNVNSGIRKYRKYFPYRHTTKLAPKVFQRMHSVNRFTNSCLKFNKNYSRHKMYNKHSCFNSVQKARGLKICKRSTHFKKNFPRYLKCASNSFKNSNLKSKRNVSIRKQTNSKKCSNPRRRYRNSSLTTLKNLNTKPTGLNIFTAVADHSKNTFFQDSADSGIFSIIEVRLKQNPSNSNDCLDILAQIPNNVENITSINQPIETIKLIPEIVEDANGTEIQDSIFSEVTDDIVGNEEIRSITCDANVDITSANDDVTANVTSHKSNVMSRKESGLYNVHVELCSSNISQKSLPDITIISTSDLTLLNNGWPKYNEEVIVNPVIYKDNGSNVGVVLFLGTALWKTLLVVMKNCVDEFFLNTNSG